jgi:hypothetical protein
MTPCGLLEATVQVRGTGKAPLWSSRLHSGTNISLGGLPVSHMLNKFAYAVSVLVLLFAAPVAGCSIVAHMGQSHRRDHECDDDAVQMHRKSLTGAVNVG